VLALAVGVAVLPGYLDLNPAESRVDVANFHRFATPR